MMKLKILILLTLAALTACSCEAPDAPSGDDAVVGTPVMFTSGNQSLSRAIPYLGENGRFVCRMYYQATQGSTDYTGQFQSWLRVNNAYGNSVYRDSLFNADENDSNLFDQFNFEKAATIFYWQNRKNHAFIAYTDLHRCFESTYNGDNGLNMINDASFTEAENTYACKKFVLTTSPTEPLTEEQKLSGDPAYYSQPDPAVANTIMLPAGATQEANRVDLIFRHCFSQIQVNLKKAADGGITSLTAAQITKVEMLGVSEEGYVCFDADPTTGQPHPASYKAVSPSDYTDEQLASNPYGTAMSMFDMGSDNYAPGYVKSFNAIAFGQLRAIRITWTEPAAESLETIKHVVTHRIMDNDFRYLQSGVRYIHNLELRRGTLAVIKTEILPWEIDETKLNGNGTVKEPLEVADATALSTALANGDDVILKENIAISSTLTIPQGSTVTIDLNGKTLTNSATTTAIEVKGDLTITGEGTVNGGSGGNNKAVKVLTGGKCTIMSGSITVGGDANNEGNDCILCEGGEVEIYGGYYSSAAAYNGFYYVLNQKNGNPGKITVYGGQFENYNPATGDDNLGGNFVASGYESVFISEAEATPKVYEVRKKTE